MGHPLITLLAQSAHHLLASSSVFEPYIPSSQQNTYCALRLLGSLAETTQIHLQVKTPPPSQKSEKVKVQDQTILNALLKLRKSNSALKRAPGIYSTILRMPPP